MAVAANVPENQVFLNLRNTAKSFLFVHISSAVVTEKGKTMPELLIVSEVARRIEVEEGGKVFVDPRDISALFASRTLPPEMAPQVGGRRLIDATNVWIIKSKLRQAGKIRPAIQLAAPLVTSA